MDNLINENPIQYRDRWVRLIAALIATHVIIVYGEPESSFELMLTRDYYTAFFGSFLIAFLLIEFVHRITAYLDRCFEWAHKSVQRVFAQLLLGFAAPGITAFFLAFVYFRLRGIDILATTYLQYDFQFILLMLALANAYYLCYYFYLKWQIAEQRAVEFTLLQPPAQPSDDFPDELKDLQPLVFNISKGAATIPISTSSIAYFYRNNETNYLRTFEGEDIFVPQALDDIEAQLDPQQFFRANRQMILSYPAIERYKVIEYGKVEALLNPLINEPAIVSQKRARSFRQWCDRNQYETERLQARQQKFG